MVCDISATTTGEHFSQISWTCKIQNVLGYFGNSCTDAVCHYFPTVTTQGDNTFSLFLRRGARKSSSCVVKIPSHSHQLDV